MASGSVAGSPADFVRGRVIEVVDAQLVQRATVPQDVYEWVSRADLGDLRVFNGQQSEVPYTLRRPTSQQEHSAWVDLPIFVLPVADASTSDGARVTVRVDDGGALVAVNGSIVTREQSAGLLIDASGLDRKISELMVTWIDAEDFFGKFQIDASDDLNSWRTVVKSSTLALLETGGHQVSADVIELPGVRARYLKVIQLDGSDDVRISTVQARSRQAELPPRQWKKITGSFSDDGYEYATEGFFPIDRVAVDFERDTFMVVARLFSKSREKDTWRSRGQRTFYRVALDGATVSSEPLAVSARDHYWRVEVKGENTQAPRLTVGWLPHEVVFLRQGPGPYLLAYGQADLVGSPWPMKELLSHLGTDPELDSFAPAQLGAANTLGGPSRLVPAPEAIDWQTVLLWGVLVIGVGMIGLFAFRLLHTPSQP